MRIASVTYGHEGTGKLYSYIDPGQHRTGDRVVVPVRHKKSGKLYKTLATIRSTHGEGTVGVKDTNKYLSDKNINLKAISGGSARVLPGFKAAQKKHGKNFTLKNWASDAKAQKQLENHYRLLPGMTDNNFNNIKKMIRELR